jgi:DNA-binding response OmpR family regulator
MMDYDEEKIQQIVYNLLSNALKFTRPVGQVILHARKVDQEGRPFLKVKVKDTGMGIPPENIDYIFDRFYQVDHLGSNKEGSTGIGLSLTKELVELMQGRIEVHSRVGKGTEFTLYLPIEAQVAATTGLLAEQNEVLKVETPEPSTPDQINSTGHREATETSDRSPLPDLLIIEDNPDIITYIKTILKHKYEIHTAKDGSIGIEKALQIMPDVIISDVMMPEISGYEVCESLKKDERTSHIPIILLTAKATQADRVEGFKYGADAYLVKPFDKEELIVRLENLVETRRQWQEHFANSTHAPRVPEPSVDDIFLQKLGEHIQVHLNNAEFGVDQLATAIAMSQMQLYRKLKALTGKTPSQFIRSYRLRKGLELLQEGALSISEIAYEVGFADPSYFTRVFQKEFGKSPSDFLR